MAEKIISPGVFTNEIDQSFLPSAVADIGAAIVGPTLKGPAGIPTVVTSFSDFQAKFGDVVKKMNGFVRSLVAENLENKEVSKTLARVKKYEDITDRIEQDVADYLTKVSQGEMSENSSIKVRGMLSIVGDLERIGDIYYQMSKGLERKIEGKVYFTPEQRKNILDMFDLVELNLTTMCGNLEGSYGGVSMLKAQEQEDALNKFRKTLRKEHFASVEKGYYNFKSAAIYADLFNSLEKVGDHVINVTEGITGEH